MTKKIKTVVFDRIKEMMIGSAVMSAVVCLLCITGPMPVGSLQRDVALSILPVIYIAWNFLTLRKCYLIMCNDRPFYVSNLCATAIFAVVSIAAYVIVSVIFSSLMLRKAYSWVFLVTCLFGFSNIGIPGLVSICLFHIVLFVSVFLAPIGLGWIKKAKEEKRELLERLPGILEVNPLEQKSVDTEVTKYEDENKNEEKKNTLS